MKILQVPGQHLPGCMLTRSSLLQAEGVHPSASWPGGQHGSLLVEYSSPLDAMHLKLKFID